MNAPDNHLERRARELYREAARHIDPATADRLRAARRKAIESSDRSSLSRRLLQLLLPAGAFAAVAFAALMLSSPVQGPAGNSPSSALSSPTAEFDGDLPPDAAAADPTLYQNMDFYGWLARNGDSQANR
ncbi:hypothetical protein [Dyella humicola]|uniref:hypothetical protein n=1 Tax=Dyella humicola TaxID=2992126 RepID=UPI002257F420|nr:hypothetical protein [Dyella humicola]